MAGFRKAKGEQAYIKMGTYGAAGSGKTFTALLIAEGLAKAANKRVAFVDTEHGADFYAQDIKERKVHPEAFDFDALYTRSITEILYNVKNLDLKTYGVIIIDSMTHVWEAAKNSYAGATTAAGTIPMHAWGKIKKPYKDLMNFLLECPAHVIINGRQGAEFAEDEATGELKRIGNKMKAEGETAYEPHILLHLESVRCGKDGLESYPVASVEKDRTGILAGQSFERPNFESVALPLLPILGSTQAAVDDEDAAAAKDAESLQVAESTKKAQSAEILEQFKARFKLAADLTEVEKIAKEITKELKTKLVKADLASLKEAYLEAGEKRKVA